MSSGDGRRTDDRHFRVPDPEGPERSARLKESIAALTAVGGLLLADQVPGPLKGSALVERLGWWCLAIAALLTVVTLWRAFRGPRARPTADQLDQATERLAGALRGQYDRDERLSRIHDPLPLPVRWGPADPLVTDHWRNIRRDPAGSVDGPDEPLDVQGRFEEIAEFFGSLPVQRLVVLGAPGAGKSVLVLRLARALLAERDEASGTPVPVVFTLASWNPRTQGLWRWAAGQLASQHPTFASGAGRRAEALALELITSGRVLPVLDGLDELPGDTQADALHELRDSLAGPARFVLTSRSGEYADAVEAGNTVLPSAVVVELQPLTAAEVASYLPRTSPRTSRTDEAATKWDPVLRRLADRDDQSREVRVVRAVLSTPLMVGLARAAYSNTAADPGELLAAGRFTTRVAVERHLFDTFMTAAYGGALDDRANTGARDARDARRWTGFLARYLRLAGEQDLAWWRLDEAVPRPVRALGTVPALAAAVLAVREAGFGPQWWNRWVGLPGWAAFALVLSAVLIGEWALVSPGELPAPRRSRRPSREAVREGAWPWQTWAKAVAWLALLVAGWTAVALAGNGFWLLWLFTAALAALAVGRFFNFLRVRADPAEAAEPAVLLRNDRRAVLAFGIADPLRQEDGSLFMHRMALLVPLMGLAMWTINGGRDVVGLGTWVRTCAAVALASALYGVAVSAWGRYSVARVWLAATGRLPWRLTAFLSDAHRRGVLRQVGGLYRFRHIELRNRLAEDAIHPSAPPGDIRTPARWAAAVLYVLAVLAQCAVGLPLGTGKPLPGPYRSLPSACSLLQGQLKEVMVDPLVLEVGHNGCQAGEQSPFGREVKVSLTATVHAAAGGYSRQEAANQLRRYVYGNPRELSGLGDEAVQGDMTMSIPHMEGQQTQVWIGARVANAVLKLQYAEEFAPKERAWEVAQILLRAVLREAGLEKGPGADTRKKNASPASTRRLSEVPRAGLPRDTRFAYYRRERTQPLTGATWTKNERSHLWRLSSMPFVFRAPKYLSCKDDWADRERTGKGTCTESLPSGVPALRLRLDLAVRDCGRSCDKREIADFTGKMPGYRSLPWKRVNRSMLYAEGKEAKEERYHMQVFRSAVGRDRVYLIWARAQVSQRHAEVAQKIVNDIVAQTGGRS
ncbi:NACHT domain-containing protein [Streptomyces sp. NPDC020845]|uniref:NACHT domain-containing protein n=1 Tax=Streptomyces sp. NPDC020845 TaxID=3365096 RepID=UPI0037AC5C3B